MALPAPQDLSADYRLYRNYIRRSKGEFTVAKDQYVRLNTGWFSDRSGCYLAAGRPVIIQETGFTKIFGKHDGLFAFKSLGEIADAVKKNQRRLLPALPRRARNRPRVFRSRKGAALAAGTRGRLNDPVEAASIISGRGSSPNRPCSKCVGN